VQKSKVNSRTSPAFNGSNPCTEQLLLEGEAEDYEFLSKSNRVVPGMDDGAEWKALKVRGSPTIQNLQSMIGRRRWTSLDWTIQSSLTYSVLWLQSSTSET